MPAPTGRIWKPVATREAAASIQTGWTLGVGWLGDGVARAIAAAFASRGAPRDLTIVYASARDAGRSHGLNLIAREGLVRRVIGGQWHPVPGLQALAETNRIEAYSWPAGVISRLFEDIASGLPGHLSLSGLGSFADPRHGGGRLNSLTDEPLVQLVRPSGREALLYRGFPVDAALIGAGFLAEGLGLAVSREALAIARAARKSGGLVIAQIDRIGVLDRLPAGQVVLPDAMADVVVGAEDGDHAAELFAPVAARR